MQRTIIFVFFAVLSLSAWAQDLHITEAGYFAMPGLEVTVFADIYPDGHQTGVTVIQHGSRVAANGDLRLEASPGQWSPVPKGGARRVDTLAGLIEQRLWYPDSSKNRRGFNPILYPDLRLAYDVEVRALTGSSFRVAVHLDEPLPAEWVGRVGFNFELFPGELFGKSWIMDEQTGYFPVQANGPLSDEYGGPLAEPMASGRQLTVAPETELQRLRFRSETGALELRDGRVNHNNGWFIVRETVPAGATREAIVWTVTPTVAPEWRYEPVPQVSQLGYHPDQPKRAIIEVDPRHDNSEAATLYRIGPEGETPVKTAQPAAWGHFLRYRYLTFDFSEVKKPGLYTVRYAGKSTHAFRIAADVYARGAWQPVLEYYLPVQMCHMRVNEKYRVWHDYCHLDDARMAPVDTNHFDGYVQGPATLTDFAPGERVPDLNRGGWHDAGDYDLRVESQIGTVWNLALMVEEFGLDYDATLIDPEQRLVEIHQADGRSDAIQQIEHGLASVLGAYRAMGRLYRGIICPTLRQYVLLGDGSAMTDNQPYQDGLSPDDRWVFTEDNPRRELYVAAGLAAAARVLRRPNAALADEALTAAETLYERARNAEGATVEQVLALTELLLTTGKPAYAQALTDSRPEIIANLSRCGWAVGHAWAAIEDAEFRRAVTAAVEAYARELSQRQATDSPYGVPYEPNIWGAGWSIQRFGVEHYFFHRAWPELVSSDYFVHALNFILGVHPGRNTASFASGVGANSVTVAYGVNRADWSFIPGGVASGTALIRPDLPELKVWPFFWQQTEYVMGGGSTNFMFLVLAAEEAFGRD